MKTNKNLLIALLIALALLVTTGCSNNAGSNNESVIASSKKVKHHKKKVIRQTNIKIKVGKTTLKAYLNNSSAAKAFAKELPKTMSFWTFSNLPEKVANLGHSLPTKGMPKGSRGLKGYIGYWSPDRRIVFYYGNESYWDGIHLIGKFDSKNYAKIIKNAPEHVKIRISK